MIDQEEPWAAYAAVEEAYRGQRWPEVLRLAEALRRQLSPDDNGIGPRLLLLEGHTSLYGFADRQAAAVLYRAVADSNADAILRRLAEEALAAIEEPLATPKPLAIQEEVQGESWQGAMDGTPQAFPFEAMPVGRAPEEAAAAAPWLAPDEPPAAVAGGVSAEVVVEPEQRLVATSDPRREPEVVIDATLVAPADDPNAGASQERQRQLARGLLRVDLD